MIPAELILVAASEARKLHDPPRVRDIRLALVANGCKREPPLGEVVEELRFNNIETATERCVSCGQRMPDA